MDVESASHTRAPSIVSVLSLNEATQVVESSMIQFPVSGELLDRVESHRDTGCSFSCRADFECGPSFRM